MNFLDDGSTKDVVDFSVSSLHQSESNCCSHKETQTSSTISARYIRSKGYEGEGNSQNQYNIWASLLHNQTDASTLPSNS